MEPLSTTWLCRLKKFLILFCWCVCLDSAAQLSDVLRICTGTMSIVWSTEHDCDGENWNRSCKDYFEYQHIRRQLDKIRIDWNLTGAFCWSTKIVWQRWFGILTVYSLKLWRAEHVSVIDVTQAGVNSKSETIFGTIDRAICVQILQRYRVAHKKSGQFHFVAYNVYATHVLKISRTCLQYLKLIKMLLNMSLH